MAEHIRSRKSRNSMPPCVGRAKPEADPNTLRSKPTISSVLLNSSPTSGENTSKKKNFTSATFRGLGCTASPQVSVPAVIRNSANWDAKKVKKKKLKTKKSSSSSNELPMYGEYGGAAVVPNNSNPPSLSLALSSSCVSVPDVWCGPGIGLTTDAASVDCVVSRRPTRGKVDGALLGQRERSSYTVRRMVIPEDNPFLEGETAFEMPRSRADVSGSRHHRHVRHGFREGLAEIVLLQGSLLMGGRLDELDRYRDLRLDVDNMSYEELLELGDRIGYVSTGLRGHDITRCLTRTKIATLHDLTSHATEMERKCTICQEEYELGDETGKLNCGHFYHLDCIQQWLGQKNICPICKTAAVS